MIANIRNRRGKLRERERALPSYYFAAEAEAAIGRA